MRSKFSRLAFASVVAIALISVVIYLSFPRADFSRAPASVADTCSGLLENSFDRIWTEFDAYFVGLKKEPMVLNELATRFRAHPTEIPDRLVAQLRHIEPREAGLSNADVGDLRARAQFELDRRRVRIKFEPLTTLLPKLKDASLEKQKAAQAALVQYLLINPEKMTAPALEYLMALKPETCFVPEVSLRFIRDLAHRHLLRVKFSDLPLAQIAAMGENWVIAKNGLLPWKIPEDTRFYLKQIQNKIFIVGRLTFEMTPPEENWNTKLTIVITSDANYRATQANVRVVRSVEEALTLAAEVHEDPREEIYIGGGGTIYSQTSLVVRQIYQTLIHREYDGDVYFPFIDSGSFDLISESPRETPVNFTFRVLRRKPVISE